MREHRWKKLFPQRDRELVYREILQKSRRRVGTFIRTLLESTACRMAAFMTSRTGDVIVRTGQLPEHNYTKVACPETGSPTCVTRRCGNRVRKTGSPLHHQTRMRRYFSPMRFERVRSYRPSLSSLRPQHYNRLPRKIEQQRSIVEFARRC